MGIQIIQLPELTNPSLSDCLVAAGDEEHPTSLVPLENVLESYKDRWYFSPYPEPGDEIPFTWQEIQTKLQNNDMTDIRRIGDWKKITLTTGQDVIMELAGVSTYWNGSSQYTVHRHLDFISREAPFQYRVINNRESQVPGALGTNNGTLEEKNPWRASTLFQELNNETTGIYSTLPDDLKPYIVEKYAWTGTRFKTNYEDQLTEDNGFSWTSLGKLWLPSFTEIFGYPPPGYNMRKFYDRQYPIFRQFGSCVCNGWGTLTPSYGDSEKFWRILTSSRSGYRRMRQVEAMASVRTPLCFRISY